MGERVPDTASLQGLRVAITGAGGQLGGYLRQALIEAGAVPVGIGRHAGPGVDVVADLSDASQLARAMDTAKPGIVIHAAAYTDVDGCEQDPDRAEAVNARGSADVAIAADGIGAQLVMVSTDFVFPGTGGAPYHEHAPTNPISVYGRSKRNGEEAVLATNAGFCVARTAWLYGGAGKHFPRTVLTVLRDRGTMDVVTDETGSPTFAGDLAIALVRLAATRARGVFHLVNDGRATRFEFAQAVAAAAGLDIARVTPISRAAFLEKFPLPAQRPGDSTLANKRAAALGIILRPWREALSAYVPQLAVDLGLAVSDRPSTLTEGAGSA